MGYFSLFTLDNNVITRNPSTCYFYKHIGKEMYSEQRSIQKMCETRAACALMRSPEESMSALLYSGFMATK